MNEPSRKTGGPDLAALRARLADRGGPELWRSLDELAETPEFQEFLHREFPRAASEWTDPASRRTFLKLMGASLALAGVGQAGCTNAPDEKIVPYVRMPEEIVPGKPLKYATAVTLGGYAIGVVAESHEGRPTMLEGNEKHPDSLGAINPQVQASLLTLYDPDRSQVVTRLARNGREISTLDLFLTAATAALDLQRPKKGAGLRVLTETVTSPTLARLIRRLQSEFPEARWHQYEPTARDTCRAGARLAFGEHVVPRYHFGKADIVLSLDADFLSRGPGHLRHAREFGLRREPKNMNRLYVVESTPTITGGMADHRLPVASRQVGEFARALARQLGVKVEGATGAAAEHERWLDAVVGDLRKHMGASLVVAGEGQPAAVHALAHALNDALGNVGKTVEYGPPVEEDPVDQHESLRALAEALEAGSVEVLLVLGGNPIYYAPADLNFRARLERAPFSAHLSLYEDETSASCRWHVPKAHELETWGDARASDGTATIQQPLINPLYDGRSMPELLAALLRHPARSGYQLVRETWRDRHKGDDESFETFWRTALHDGVVADTATKTKSVKLKGDLALGAGPKTGTGLELTFQLDPTIGDGRWANNPWLQELPNPITKLTWGNAVLVAPKTAERLKLGSEDVVVVSFRGRAVQGPVWVTPGQAEDSVAVSLGYGRTNAGRVGDRVGFNAYALRTSDAPWFGAGLELIPTNATITLACTQNHRPIDKTRHGDRDDLIEGPEAEKREVYRAATLADFLKDPHFAHEGEHEDSPPRSETLYHDDFPYQGKGHAWGMSVNLNTCIGCNACVIACQAENNIPVVGKEEVLRGREMHWIDLDRYYHGTSLDNPITYFQPRFCMHCENAPCELVCPVAATVHDAEGINDMIYNRCVGTRYCSNNCPYKVRHFNFLHYSDLTRVYQGEKNPPSLKLLQNPDVTVRARGVMEKCTYCVQRINAARYEAEREGREIRDGDVVPACQAACPTQAIVFGDINDKNSRVSRLKTDPRDYGMLAELNTKPRTTYIAKLRNPNPELETEGAA